MLALLSGLSLLAFAYARADPTPRALAFWVLASALALATHYYAVLAVVPEAVWLLWIHRTRRPVQIAFAVVGLCGLGLIPLAISQHGTGRGNWISNAPFWRRLGQIVPQFSSGFEGPAHGVFEPLAIAICGSVVGSAPDAGVGRGAARGAARRWARARRVRAQPDPGRGWLRRPADAQHAGDLDGLRAARRRRVGRAAPARCRRRRRRRAVRHGCDDRGRRRLRSQLRAARLARGGAGARHACAAGRPRDPRPALSRSVAAVAVRAGLEVLAGWSARASPRVRRCVVHLAGERRLLLVGFGVQPVAVTDAGRPTRSPASGRCRSGVSFSSPSSEWWLLDRCG